MLYKNTTLIILITQSPADNMEDYVFFFANIMIIWYINILLYYVPVVGHGVYLSGNIIVSCFERHFFLV